MQIDRPPGQQFPQTQTMFGFWQNKTPQPTAEESSDKPLGFDGTPARQPGPHPCQSQRCPGDLLGGSRQIDDDLLEDIETLLLTADVGVDATRRIIADLTARVRRKELADPAALGGALREQLAAILLRMRRPTPGPHPAVPW